MRLGPKALVGLGLGLALTRNKGVPVPPAGYGFLRVGSPGASQLVRVRIDGVAPRILIPTGS
jgi:hypothetical protein